jgi:nucleoside-diphosphate-sugar epimerase
LEEPTFKIYCPKFSTPSFPIEINSFLQQSEQKENLIKKYDVKCLIRNSSDTRFINNLDVEIQIGDITKKDTLDKVTKDVDFVFHLAALMRKWNLSDKTYWDINLKGTKNILEMSSKDK